MVSRVGVPWSPTGRKAPRQHKFLRVPAAPCPPGLDSVYTGTVWTLPASLLVLATAGGAGPCAGPARALAEHVVRDPWAHVVDFRDPRHRIEQPAYAELDIRGAFSLSLWMLVEGSPRSPESKIFSLAGVSDGKITLMLSDDRLELLVRRQDGTQLKWVDDGPPARDRWQLLVVDYDPAQGARGWIDGAPRALRLASLEQRPGPLRSLPQQELYLGCLDRCFPGRLDDIRLYGRRLRTAERAALLVGEAVDEGLVGHWPLDGEGSAVANLAPGAPPATAGERVARGEPGAPALGAGNRSSGFGGKHGPWAQRLRALEDSLARCGGQGSLPHRPAATVEERLAATFGARLRYTLGERGLQLDLRWIEENGTARHELLSLGPATEFTAELAAARAELERDGSAQGEATRALAARLLDIPWGHAGPGAAAWYLELDGWGGIPFAALPLPGGGQLVDQVAVAHAAPPEHWHTPPEPAGEFLALGDPAFGVRDDQRSGSPWADDALADDRPRAGGGCLELSPWLYGSRREVEELAALVPGATAITWEAASESTLAAVAPRAGVLHLATHGYRIDPECLPALPRSPLLRVGLELAGSGAVRTDTKRYRDDGYLSAFELSRLDLRRCELVVFSGCRTALGPEAGQPGLVEAATAAGARASVASLWDVGDDATRLFMLDLHRERLAGHSLPEAMRRAQLAARARDRRDYGEASPRRWAAWVVAGYRP